MATAVIFVMSLFALVAISTRLFGVGLPTCLTDVKPFEKSDVIFHSPLHYEVHYVAKMWAFEPENVTIPTGSDVDIYLSSTDVTHGFQILGTNVNLMAVPGAVNYSRVKFTKPGTYHVVCHEYCGTGHHAMATTITVTDPTVQGAPMAGQTPTPAQAGHPGQKALENRACLACHTTDGRPSTGPTLKGLFGKTEALEAGGNVTVDEAYLRESILNPMAKVVKGFPPSMPKIPLSDSEVDQIVDYIKTLK